MNARCLAGLYLVGCLVLPALTARSQPFGGLIAIAGIDFKGNNVTVDSFNSQDPLHSDWQTNYTYHGSNYGTYPFLDPVGKQEASAVVATCGSSINVGNADIYGYVDTAPGGNVRYSINGSVGDVAWVSSRISGIQSGHIRDDMNATLPDVTLPTPAGGWSSVSQPAGGVIIGGVNYTYVISSPGNYEISSTLQSSIYIGSPNVTLYLPSGMNLQSGRVFTVGTNADVTIYSGGPIGSGSTGTISNLNQTALALSIYGLPAGVDANGDVVVGCTSISVGGGSAGTSYVYAPEASLTFSGGGNTVYNEVGALVAHDITVNGHFNFHFDEALGNILPPWIGTPPTNKIVQAGSNAVFAVNAGGPYPNYQWFFNRTNLITAATSPLLVLTNVQMTNAGCYSVLVSNSVGSVTSAPASLVVWTDATPTLSAAFVPTNGQFQFNIAGVTGLNYSVQVSTDLVSWLPVATNVSPFLFSDTNAGLVPQRFYRSVYPP